MATIRIGKYTYTNVECVKIYGTEDCQVQLKYFDGTIKNVVIPGNNKLLVEMNGDLREGKISNCATVFGNIMEAYVGNYLKVEGIVCNAAEVSKRVRVNRDLKVRTDEAELLEYRKQLQKRQESFSKEFDEIFGEMLGKMSSTSNNSNTKTIDRSPKRKIVHIEGNLKYLEHNLSNRSLIVEIHGNVGSIYVTNGLSVKGKIKELKNDCNFEVSRIAR